MYACILTVYIHIHTQTHKLNAQMHMHTNAHTVQVSTLLLQCMVVKKALNIMASMHTYAQCVHLCACACVCTLLVYIRTYPLSIDTSCQRMFTLLLNYSCMSALYSRFHRGGLLHTLPQSHQRQSHHHPPCFQGHDHWPSPGWQDCSASPPP